MRDRPFPHRQCSLPASLDRRAFLTMLAAGAVAVLEACSAHRTAAKEVGKPSTPGGTAAPVSSDPVPPLPPIPARHPGDPHLVSHAPSPTPQIALTIDDGYCRECVAGYVT